MTCSHHISAISSLDELDFFCTERHTDLKHRRDFTEWENLHVLPYLALDWLSVLFNIQHICKTFWKMFFNFLIRIRIRGTNNGESWNQSNLPISDTFTSYSVLSFQWTKLPKYQSANIEEPPDLNKEF